MSAQLTFALTQQLVALIKRDFLTYLSPFGYTEDFNWYDMVQLWPEDMPAVLVYESTNNFNPSSQNTFMETALYRVRVQLNDMDHNVVGQKMRGYLGALCNQFAHYDWERQARDLCSPLPLPVTLAQIGTTTPGVVSNVTEVRVVGETFDEFGATDPGFMMRGTVHLLVTQEEIL